MMLLLAILLLVVHFSVALLLVGLVVLLCALDRRSWTAEWRALLGCLVWEIALLSFLLYAICEWWAFRLFLRAEKRGKDAA